MQQLSVVIICKNSAGVIEKTLQSFAGLTDDIVVYDNGSADNTAEIVKHIGANFYSGSWEGFGKTKNKANHFAKYNWILSLDADEGIDDELKHSLLQLALAHEKTVYRLKFRNFVGNRYLKYGEWGTDNHIRLFNRNQVQWNDAAVHEELTIPDDVEIKKLNGYVLHRTTNSFLEYEKKMEGYAALNAQKYFKQGKKVMLGKGWLSAGFSFLKNYIFRLGFLDGKDGFECARINARYTYLKYKNLKKLVKNKQTGKQ